MRILFTRFPYESANGGAERQTQWLASGLVKRGHSVSFLGQCRPLLTMLKDVGVETHTLVLGLPPVTMTLALSFLWRKSAMQKKLIAAVEALPHTPDVIVMLSLSEKILLTEWAAKKGIKVFWIEHDRLGRWLSKNPWLGALKRASQHAKIVCVSELSRKMYIDIGFDAARVVAIPNGIPLPPSSPNPFSRGEKGKVGGLHRTEEKKAMNPQILEFARSLRKESTEAEEILWQSLRNSQLGVKFRRQHPIQQRILDFYCHAVRLGIEVDGSIHEESEQRQYDHERDEFFHTLGIRILRFTNDEVLHGLDVVLLRIQEYLRSPPPSGEGLGVGVGVQEDREKAIDDNQGLKLGCIARLSPEKGIDVLIQSLAGLPEIDLTIVGTGSEEGYLRSLVLEDATRIGVERIRIVQHIDDLESFYASLDVCVLPSSDHDPFGLVATEAMARGIATVVTDACGIAGYLAAGKDALIAEAGSADSLQSALRILRDPAVRTNLAKEGMLSAKALFSAETMVDSYQQAFGTP